VTQPRGAVRDGQGGAVLVSLLVFGLLARLGLGLSWGSLLKGHGRFGVGDMRLLSTSAWPSR
jgi:hypothetical protein